MSQSETSGGIGLLGAVFLILFTLKLIGQITWSWIWVFTPLWFPFAIMLVGGVVFILISMVSWAVSEVWAAWCCRKK